MTVAARPVPDTRAANDWIRVASLADLRQRGVIVVRGADRPIAVYAHDGEVSAVDNRCPHMGFPLHRGTVQDGILTCHWHHARFDLCSGCTFDLFADDVEAYDTEVRDDEVFVAPLPRPRDAAAHYRRRLREGMEQNLSLIQAKAIAGLLKAGADYREIVREVALFGVRYRDGWGAGLTSLTVLANLYPYLGEETGYLALYQGARRVAADAAGQEPRRDRHPLENESVSFETLKRWLESWTVVRQRDAAERTVLTAIANGAERASLTDLHFSAATKRFFADTGHLTDFSNKAFEMLDLIGWEHAPRVLPAVMQQLASARGGEEMNAWRHPLDLVPPLNALAAELPDLLRQGEGRQWNQERALGDAIQGDDPLAVLAAIRSALVEGARPEQVGKSLCYAAAMRIARFGTANEFGDWISALHTFSYCNALHQALRRSPTSGVLRGALHGAISVYLDRFLNVPPARLPGERGGAPLDLEYAPREPEALLEAFMASLDQQQNVAAAALAVARYLALGHPVRPLFDALTRAAVREDADFHTFQMVEAAVRQYHEWEGMEEGQQILIGAARYLAAHSPSQRAQLQTAQIALRLHRGESLYEED